MAGVSDAVTTPPTCPPMFIVPDTAPAERFPISALTDQKELCDRYNMPAPPDSTRLANCALATCAPSAIKSAANPMAAEANKHRPTRLPYDRVSSSLIQPPSVDPTAIAMKGSIV